MTRRATGHRRAGPVHRHPRIASTRLGALIENVIVDAYTMRNIALAAWLVLTTVNASTAQVFDPPPPPRITTLVSMPDTDELVLGSRPGFRLYADSVSRLRLFVTTRNDSPSAVLVNPARLAAALRFDIDGIPASVEWLGRRSALGSSDGGGGMPEVDVVVNAVDAAVWVVDVSKPGGDVFGNGDFLITAHLAGLRSAFKATDGSQWLVSSDRRN